MIYGIDVANYQPPTLPTTTDGHPVDFVFVKATEGHTTVNSEHAAQVASARKDGAVVGHYHFLWPGDIGAQANWFVSHCDLKPGELLVCDWETTQANTYASNAEKDAFIAAVKKLAPGHRVGLYCNVDYWKRHDATSDCGDFLWIAAPGTATPPIKHPWTIWQYGDHGGFDRNSANFADRAAMKKWAGYPAPTPPPPPGPAPTPAPSVKDQVAAIEKTFATLTGQLAELKKSVGL